MDIEGKSSFYILKENVPAEFSMIIIIIFILLFQRLITLWHHSVQDHEDHLISLEHLIRPNWTIYQDLRTRDCPITTRDIR